MLYGMGAYLRGGSSKRSWNGLTRCHHGNWGVGAVKMRDSDVPFDQRQGRVVPTCTTVTRSFDLSVLVSSTVRLKDNGRVTQEGSGVFGKVFCYLQSLLQKQN